jgi:hypothetical protein
MFKQSLGIRLFCADPKLNSILYANRAAAHRHLGNLRSAIRDCLFARRLQPDNAKVSKGKFHLTHNVPV